MASPGKGRADRGVKKEILSDLWARVKARGPPYGFDNDEVRKLCEGRYDNFADLPKIDSMEDLSASMKEDDVFIVHLGQGRHRFVSPVSAGFRKIPLDGPTKEWEYRRKILDDLDEGEAGALSIMFNQQIAQHFLFGDRQTVVRIHLPGRTRRITDNSFTYRVGTEEVAVRGLQIEMDFIVERNGLVAFAEAKRDPPKGEGWSDFAVSQLYLPYRKLLNLRERSGEKFEVRCLFVLRRARPEKRESVLVCEYAFDDPKDMASVKAVGSMDYLLVPT